MGVTLTTALVLAFVSAYVEIALMKRVPLLCALSKRYLVFSIVFSIILSYVLGMFFGASGVVPLIAGLLSTVATEPMHAFHRMDANSQVKVFVRDVRETYKPVWKGVVVLAKVATSFLWVPVMIHRRNNLNKK